MSDYTHLNLSDVTNIAEERGIEGFDARFARDALHLKNSGLTVFTMQPGFRVPFGHRHAEQEESFLVVQGSGRVRIESEIVELATWDVLRIGPSPVRAFEAGDDGMVLVAFGEGPKGDGEMVPGFWED